MFCSNCGAQLSDNNRFCPSCGAPVVAASANPPQQQTPGQQVHGGSAQQGAQPYGQQPGTGQSPAPFNQAGAPQPPLPHNQQPQMNATVPDGKKTNRVLIGVVVALAVVVVGLVTAIALGVFSPKQTGGVPAASSSSSQSVQASVTSGSSQSGPSESSSAAGNASASSAASVAATGAGGASSSASSASSSAASPTASASASSGASQGSPSASGSSTGAAGSGAAASADARKVAVDEALGKGYQIFEGTLRVLSTEDLANLQGVDPAMFTGDGMHAVLVFDAPFQVSGMGADGSGARRQGASMLGVAEYSDYGSFVIDKGDVDAWVNFDGKHLVLGAAAEQIWFPSDVSLPVGEPSTQDAIVVWAD